MDSEADEEAEKRECIDDYTVIMYVLEYVAHMFYLYSLFYYISIFILNISFLISAIPGMSSYAPRTMS